ncbi:MAG TPA: hypothetical protein PLV25_07700, partial [Opitutales bacterium]|nr:hypothetical protein [Opitutales bacterium]
ISQLTGKAATFIGGNLNSTHVDAAQIDSALLVLSGVVSAISAPLGNDLKSLADGNTVETMLPKIIDGLDSVVALATKSSVVGDQLAQVIESRAQYWGQLDAAQKAAATPTATTTPAPAATVVPTATPAPAASVAPAATPAPAQIDQTVIV